MKTLLHALLLVPSVTTAQPSTTSPAPPASPAPNPQSGETPFELGNRVGLDVQLVMGLVVSLGGAARYEYEDDDGDSTLYRLGYHQGAVIGSDGGAEADLFTLHHGDRWYWGRGYVALELGVIAIRRRRFDDGISQSPTSWLALPDGSLGIGGKLEWIDVGLAVTAPRMGVLLHLGIDFVKW